MLLLYSYLKNQQANCHSSCFSATKYLSNSHPSYSYLCYINHRYNGFTLGPTGPNISFSLKDHERQCGKSVKRAANMAARITFSHAHSHSPAGRTNSTTTQTNHLQTKCYFLRFTRQVASYSYFTLRGCRKIAEELRNKIFLYWKTLENI